MILNHQTAPPQFTLLLPSFQPGTEDNRHVQALLGTAVVSAPLRLRHEGGEGRVAGGCEPQAPHARPARVPGRPQSHPGRESAQVPGSGS